MENEKIVVLDFGGQYNQLIARRVRELNVYAEVLPFNVSVERIKGMNPKGIIFTGGPASVLDEDAPFCDKEIFNLNIPILGICYGMQMTAQMLGGEVKRAENREYGKVISDFGNSKIFSGITGENQIWMSHTYYVAKAPDGFRTVATSDNCRCVAMENVERNIYAVQFHPEVMHTINGQAILKNFLYEICNCIGDWKMDSFATKAIEEIKAKVGDGKVLCALSGGVDSSVAATLIHKAVGKQLTCIFVDHGLLRKDEGDEVEKIFKERFDMNLIRVNAGDRFLSKLAGVSDPETKRKTIGAEFINVFEEEAKKLGKVDFLVQGTIYPDVIESGGIKGSAVIKSHHNVGGLPEHVDFKEIIEPLRMLFKDEVRALGEELGIPHDLVWRQPFPGPGLAIRIIGDITENKVKILQEADFIYRDEIKKAGLQEEIWQYFAVLTNMRSVGVMGDERTYDYTLALRGVTSVDGMTADWARIPYDVLEKISTRIVNEVGHINRVVYDITSKPPATIEWE